jgi:multidrug efflux system membrane fusion protein
MKMDDIKKMITSIITDSNKRNTALFIIAGIFAIFLIKEIFFKTPPPHMPPKPVQTAIATAKDSPVYIETFGSIVPPEDVNIKSQVEGEIKEVHFNDGQDVKKGDLLFTIDPSTYKAQLDKAKAQIVQDQADLNLKKTTLDRNKKLLTDKLISQQQYDQYQTDVDSSTAKLVLDQANAELANINLGYCRISSPIDGRAGKCMVDPGNIITANTGATLVNIKTIDPMYLDFTVPERDLPRVRQAMDAGVLKAVFTLQGDDKNSFEGDIIFLDNTVDNSTGTVMMRARCDNANRALWAGQFANIHLILKMEKDAVLVPYEAVRISLKGPYVFAVGADNKVELKIITTGNRQGDDIVVNTGVSKGEKVVTVGQLGLSPGMVVEDITSEKSGQQKQKP